MIIVKIERWPDHADPDDPRERSRPHTDIARAVIRNDKTGSFEEGNYSVELYDPPAYNPWAGATLRTEVRDFPRRERGAWDLLYRALEPLVGPRNHADAPVAAPSDDDGQIAGGPPGEAPATTPTA